MTVIVPTRVKHQIKNFGKGTQQLVNSAIKELESNPRPNGCLKIENEKDMWRIRTGEYRIAYHISGDKIEIVRACHRSKFYARKEL